jgi:SAM-dependent methyltransferase
LDERQITLRERVSNTGLRRAHRLNRRLQRKLRRRFERRMGGVEIIGSDYLEDHGVDPTERAPYGWTPWLPIKRALKRLDPKSDDVFADLGCGKGQPVLIAASLPFRRVVGVEIVEQWAAVARQNVARAQRDLLCDDVRIEHVDALDWPVPDDLTVAYMFDPFYGTVFERVVARLVTSYDRQPRTLRVLYTYPWGHNHLIATGRFAVVDVNPAKWPARPRWWLTPEVIVTYEVVTSGATASVLACRRRRAAYEHWRGSTDTRFVQSVTARGAPPLYSDHPDDARPF